MSETSRSRPFLITRAKFDAVIFDLDGVVTRTATVHAAAWKQLFDDYCEERRRRKLSMYEPFSVDHDYRLFLDGKPRYDGTKSFLESRKIDLPFGEPIDPPEKETVCGLANRKNRFFKERLEKMGVEVFDSTIRLIGDLRAHGFLVAIISASKNCSTVLRLAKITHLFEAQVDGLETALVGLKGKPAPDVFLEAAKRLGVEPKRAVVVEDAIAGVRAGRQGGFGFVIGVDRLGSPEGLKENGADLVVPDLAEVAVDAEEDLANRRTADLPSALTQVKSILGDSRRQRVVFLDYDGTLTPIVSRPEDAVMSDEMRDIVRRLAAKCTVAVISGRDLRDVQKLVGIEEIIYAGSHGFDIVGPDGLRKENEEAQAYLPALDQAEARLRKELASVPGSQVERKKYTIAIHFRNVAENHVKAVAAAVEQAAAQQPNLRRASGKKVFELQPAIKWHKGRAVLWLLEALDLNHPEVLPLYLGDDLTDEDAFKALDQRGLGIVVRDEPRPTAATYALENTREVGVFLERLMG